MEQLRREIQQFRKKLLDWDGKELSVAFETVPNFKNKDHYPTDFQIFMEEIGELRIGCDGVHADAVHVLSVEAPMPICDVDKSKMLDPVYVQGDWPNQANLEDIMLVASDAWLQPYGFDTCSTPYKFTTCEVHWELTDPYFDFDNFFPWLKTYLTFYFNDQIAFGELSEYFSCYE